MLYMLHSMYTSMVYIRDVNLGVFLLSRDNQILKYTVSR